MVPQWIPNLRHRCHPLSRNNIARPRALIFEREVPCTSLHKDEVKMHESPKKRTKAAPAPTIEGDVPCTSLPVDKDNERSDRIKIICDPMTTSMKIPTMQRPRKKSKLARSGNVSISAAIMKIFLMSQDSIDLESQRKPSSQLCGMQ